jgi:primosomal protein N' (replication factor Y)
VVWREEEVSRATVDAPLVEPSSAPELTAPQREAVAEIDAAVSEQRDEVFLLYGITGSGKTEVYLRASARALRRERGVIVLVPEISLTHQLVDRFRARFGDHVFLLHSGLSAGERFDQWRRIRESGRGIAIGARSAVFAPFDELALIVIDEEHDPSYKSEDAFRYHARDVAQLRARSAGCPLVLGSATPDVETAQRSRLGEIRRLVLPERIASRPLPRVEIVDMNQEQKLRGRRMLLSRSLRRALAETLAANQQAILFLNRRGFATHVYCFACGHALRCQHCDVSLVYHATGVARRVHDPAEGELRCHYCGYREDPHTTCPGCGSHEGALLGFGTERLHEEVSTMFPHARVTRFDRDTSSGKGEQRRILAEFHRHEIDVLVGTQMVAKGHDVPGVTLVGVIAADLGLHFPDFRAGERTFQLLTQVAGRAGRGDEPGRVVIQTFLPDHYAIALARTHDYPSFLREELARREPHGYPPFRSMLQVALSGRKAGAVEEAASVLARLAATVPRDGAHPRAFEVLGPAPAPLTRVRDQFRWQLLLLGDREDVHHVARELWRQARGRFSGVSLRLDTGPIQML